MYRYRDILNYIVGLLYILRKNQQAGYYDAKEIISVFQSPVSNADVFEMIKYLEAQGYIRAIYFLGGASIEIAPRGILMVEDDKTGIIDKVRAILQPLKAQPQEETTARLDEVMFKKRGIVLERLAEIRRIIEKEVGKETGKEYLIDIGIIESELGKIKPDMDLIARKMNNIGDVNVVRPIYKDLIVLLNL